MINFSSLQYRAHNWCTQYRPPEERTPEYILMHATEELGEVVKCLRRKQFKRKWGKKAGVPHPEGIGSEIADVVIMMAILAEELGLDGADDIEVKMKSLEDRLHNKLAKEKAKKRKKK
jgi:NTP pyrophosphatase (non-canonical NTP hydrolase)